MAEVILGNNNIEVLVVKIKDDEYSIPLGGSIPYGKLKTMKTDKDFVNYFEEHIPTKVFETLTVNEIRALSNAWSKATKEAQGITMGE